MQKKNVDLCLCPRRFFPLVFVVCGSFNDFLMNYFSSYYRLVSFDFFILDFFPYILAFCVIAAAAEETAHKYAKFAKLRKNN